MMSMKRSPLAPSAKARNNEKASAQIFFSPTQ